MRNSLQPLRSLRPRRSITLLLWAQLYRESRDPELLRRFVQSFRYYRAWHLDPTDPDRVFLLPGRRCWFVEFKAADGRLSPRQCIVHKDHAAWGHPVTVIRSTAAFKTALDIELEATAE